MLTWSLFTLFTPAAAHTSFAMLLFVRAGMGMGEGMALPSVHFLLSRCGVADGLSSVSSPLQMGAVQSMGSVCVLDGGLMMATGAVAAGQLCVHRPDLWHGCRAAVVATGIVLVAACVPSLGHCGPGVVSVCVLVRRQ